MWYLDLHSFVKINMKQIPAFLLIALCLIAIAVPSVNSTALEVLNDPKKEGFGCDLCQFIVGWVEDKIAGNKTQDWVMREANNTCNLLPGLVSPVVRLNGIDMIRIYKRCRNLVVVYVPQIFDLLKHRFPPNVICQRIKLCSAVQMLVPDLTITETDCAHCMFFATLSVGISRGTTDPNVIKQRLNNMCLAILNKETRAYCEQFIKKPNLVANLVNQVSPGQICKSSGDCAAIAPVDTLSVERVFEISDKAREYYAMHPFHPDMIAQSTLDCQLCQWIFSAYQSWLTDPTTEAEIALFLSQLCNFFGNYAKNCEQLVRVYVPRVIQSYVERTTPPMVCASIQFCHFSNNKFL